MDNPSTKFMFYEKWLFRIYMAIVVFAFGIVAIIQQVGDRLAGFADAIGNIMVLLMFAPIILFVTAFVRIIKFLVKLRNLEDRPTIWRSIVTLLTSPVFTVVYFIIVFVVLLSMASCTYSG